MNRAACHFDVAVIGGGLVGAACAYALRRERPAAHMILIENDSPSSLETSPGLATLLTKSPDIHMQLTAEGLRLHEEWRAARPDANFPRGDTLGALLILEGDYETLGLAELAEQVRAFDPFVETLTAEEVRHREPAYTGKCHGGLFAPGVPRVDIPELAMSWTREAVGGHPQTELPNPGATHGVLLHSSVGEIRPLTNPTGWQIHTHAGILSATELVLAAGLDTARLLCDLGWRLPLRPRRVHAVVTCPGSAMVRHAVLAGSYMAAKLDCDPPEDPSDESSVDYGLIAVPTRRSGLWLGETRRWSCDDRLRSDERLKLLHGAISRLKGFDPETVERELVGLRCTTPDGLPLVGRFADLPQLLVATGHDGDAVAMAPLTGHIIAELASGRTPRRINIDELRPTRFGRDWMPAEPESETLSG